VAAVKEVAEALRNTPATTREFYIHPAVLAAHEAGTLCGLCRRAAAARRRAATRELRRAEVMTLAVLRAAG
jgi:DNA topoisomerase-1